MENDDLKAIENAAAEIAFNAGGLLLNHFTQTLAVEYKEDYQKSPVTEADLASDKYIKRQIGLRFPHHAILSEEDTETEEKSAEFTWVIDPLDGTTNFMHGIPIFGICIAVLKNSRPVVGAIFTPSINHSKGLVLHASLGNGIKQSYMKSPKSTKYSTNTDDRAISSMPAHFSNMFKYRTGTWLRLGDVRSLGSVAYEMALVSQGNFDFVVFNGPHIWDVAAGVLIARESGLIVYEFDSSSNKWANFHQFNSNSKEAQSSPSQLRKWRGALLIGEKNHVDFMAKGMRIKENKVRKWIRKIQRKWLYKS